MNEKIKKALIIDDDQLVCRVVEKILTRRGIQVIVAPDGAAANSVIINDGENLTIAIIDLVLPDGVTGWDIIDFARRTPKTAHIPIIVMTGAVLSEEEEEKFRNKACTIVRKKDFNIESFKEVIDRLIGGEKA